MRTPRVLVALSMALLVPAAVTSLPLSPRFSPGLDSALSSGGDVVRAPTTTIPAPVVAPATVLDNPFIPENANIGDCASALPRPDCGSEARGGWPQTFVLIALLAGLSLIGLRLVVAVRRRG